MMLPWVKSFLAGTAAPEPAQTLATAAELRAGTSTARRAITPQLLGQLASTSGPTASRPTDALVGFVYFDTTLGRPVYLKVAPSTWVFGDGLAA
jgi:hypothetical protein